MTRLVCARIRLPAEGVRVEIGHLCPANKTSMYTCILVTYMHKRYITFHLNDVSFRLNIPGHIL